MFIKLQIKYFKLHVYKSRERGTLDLSRFMNEKKKLKL